MQRGDACCTPSLAREIDHLVALHVGGDDSPGNLRLLCSERHRAVTEEQRSMGSMLQFQPFASYTDPGIQEAVFHDRPRPFVHRVTDTETMRG